MSGLGRLLRRAAALAAGSMLMLPVMSATAVPVTKLPKPGVVRLTVVDVNPSVPARTIKPKTLTITVRVRNRGAQALTGVSIRANRGTPVATQGSLDAMLDDGTPSPDGLSVTAKKPVVFDLPPGDEITTTFTTTTSIQDDGSGLCLCDDVVYPILLSAYATDATAGEVRLTTVATYVPSILTKVTPVKVSWVWPLIDRPHRLTGDTVFFDDALTDNVAGGRLDGSLRTLELLNDTVPLTVLIDPELLDELEVMAAGKYTVQANGSATATPGTGQIAARDWLSRLKSLLTDTPKLQVGLTPPADPDVQALTRDGLTWSTTLRDTTEASVTDALPGRELRTDIAWPAEGAVTTRTLRRLGEDGTGTVLLNSGSVSPSTTDRLSNSVALLPTPAGPVTAALTSPRVQRQVALGTDLSSGAGAASTALPALSAALAVRAIQSGTDASYAVLTPPRYVNPDPAAAARIINETSSGSFAAPMALRDLTTVRPAKPSRLKKAASTKLSMPTSLVSDVRVVLDTIPALRSLLSGSVEAQPVIAGLPVAVQRLSSTAWRSAAGNPYGAALGVPLAAELAARVDDLVTGVHIVKPSSGSYTLGSDNSKLPITVENTLPYTVQVRVTVTATQGATGYVGKQSKAKIAPNSLQTVQVSSQVERSGRIPVEAQLLTPNRVALGKPVALSVDSTVFGVIGVLITVIAGGVLVVALLLRLVRRVRRRRRRTAPSAA